MVGRWLKQLQKIPEVPRDSADKTDKTSRGEVLSVLSVRPRAFSVVSKPDTSEAPEGSVSFVSSSYGRSQDLYDRAGWDDEDWQAAFDERAAILEFDAGQSREEAEHSARSEIDALWRGDTLCRR